MAVASTAPTTTTIDATTGASGGGGGGGGNFDCRACPLGRLHVLLHKIDAQLGGSAALWAMIETVFDTLRQKEEQGEAFVAFAAKPGLAPRFLERLNEYGAFWRNISQLVKANLLTFPDPLQQYSFVEGVEVAENRGIDMNQDQAKREFCGIKNLTALEMSPRD